MDEKTILGDLRKQFGKRTLLTDEDLEPFLNMSRKTQANRRSKGTFPIEVIKVGGSPLVSIYALAEWLAKKRAATEDEPLADETPVANSRRANPRKRGSPDELKETPEDILATPLDRQPLGDLILPDK